MKLVGLQLLLGALLLIALVMAVEIQNHSERLLSPADVTSTELSRLFPSELIPSNLAEIQPERSRPGVVLPPEPFAIIGYGDRTDTSILAFFSVPGTRSRAIRGEASVAQLCARFRGASPSFQPCPILYLEPVQVGNFASAWKQSHEGESLVSHFFMRN